MSELILSEKQTQYCLKVKELFLDIPGITIKSLSETLFFITEPESGVEFTADVEGDVLFLRAEIETLPKTVSPELYRFLLEQNTQTLHVAFGIDNNLIVLTGNLEIENMDLNELEASCKSLILTFYRASDQLSTLLGKK